MARRVIHLRGLIENVEFALVLGYAIANVGLGAEWSHSGRVIRGLDCGAAICATPSFSSLGGLSHRRGRSVLHSASR